MLEDKRKLYFLLHTWPSILHGSKSPVFGQAELHTASEQLSTSSKILALPSDVYVDLPYSLPRSP